MKKNVFMAIVLLWTTAFGLFLDASASTDDTDSQLTVMVHIFSDNMPAAGNIGTDVLVFGKTSSRLLSQLRNVDIMNGKMIKIPFRFMDIPKETHEDFIIKVYGATFNDGEMKFVGLQKKEVRNGTREVTLDLNLKEVGAASH